MSFESFWEERYENGNGKKLISIETAKLNDLMTVWIEHERWIQAGCSEGQSHIVRFPGYLFLAEQDVRGYGMYRHALVPFFSEAYGFSGVHESLMSLINDAEKLAPDLFSRIMSLYEIPEERFRAQWGNLFGPISHNGLTHQTLLSYQQKFEVELPLFFLAQLREIVTKGTVDENLDRFRDKKGNLKKGVIIQYLIDGLSNYNELCAVVSEGYQPKLRNAIGHNSYVIEKRAFRTLDQGFRLTDDEFSHCFKALQVIQNATLWYLMSRNSWSSELKTKGIVAIGWAIISDSVEDYPQLIIYQLEPFYSLEPECGWLRRVTIRQEGNLLLTELSELHSMSGELFTGLEPVLERVDAGGKLRCTVVPVMPCLHEHEGIFLVDGEYCQVLEEKELVLPAQIVP